MADYVYLKTTYTNYTNYGRTAFSYKVMYDLPNRRSLIEYSIMATGIIKTETVLASDILVTFNNEVGTNEKTEREVTTGTIIAEGRLIVKHSDNGFPPDVVASYSVKLNGEETSNTESLHIPNMIGVIGFESVPNFNDEQNPTLKLTSGGRENLKNIKVCMSLDGTNPYTAWKTTGNSSVSFVFNFTDTERTNIRNLMETSSMKVYFIVTSTYLDPKTNTTYPITRNKSTTLALINAEPILEPTVVDSNEKTVALTGDENVFIKGYSNGKTVFNHAGVKGASIVYMKLSVDGVHAETDQTQHQGITKYAVKKPVFEFTVKDSRKLITTKTVTKQFVEYVPLTVNQKAVYELEDGLPDRTAARIRYEVNGSYFNNTFGAVENDLKVEIRHTQFNGDMGEWVTLTDGLIPVFDSENNTYKLNITITNPDGGGIPYDMPFTFQARATDKLNVVETEEYTTRYMPVFDWSNEDFNFNVPINLNNQTVMRLNDTGRLVLSGGGDYVFIRPNGTDNEEGQLAISSTGDLIIKGNLLSDYIVECGTTSMGSNGTWYWTKWNSGKAECYGSRNFGKVSITGTWNGLYESTNYYNQSLPSGLFNSTPIVQMTLGDTGGYGVMLERGVMEVDKSNTNTGSWYFVSSGSVTTTSSYVDFYCIGRWK